MAKTAEQMTRRALQVLGAVASGQPVSAEDAASIDLNATAARLAGERIADLTAYVAGEDLPDALFIPFCDVVAADHAVIFGMPAADAAALKSAAQNELRRIIQRTRPLQDAQMPKIVGC